MATNLDSVFYVGQAVAKRMIPRGHGKIVNTCSVGSEIARPTIAPYTTVEGRGEDADQGDVRRMGELRHPGERHRPGLFQDRAEPGRSSPTRPSTSGCRKRTPAGRWGELDELIGVAVLLASAASSFVNGQVFYVDGGLLSSM